ncbi:MAG: Hydroxyacylglutathione hydrolase [Gammaproteobacteria bacterium]|nr:Hydroxyacylglutathione hydrolase [Gammaproteobacteria bacterium]
MPSNYIDYQDYTSTIDADYVQPDTAGFHLMIENGRAAFFDTGTSLSLPNAKAVLKEKGLSNDDVQYVVPTHVHLDHAGGAGAMMRAFPRAQMIVHPKGARHMIDPTKLWRSTVAVYGEKRANQLYGEIVPVAKDRVIVAEDDTEIDFQGRKLLFIDTPGHARHHFCVIDRERRAVFAGDMLGISYRIFDNGLRPFVFPSTTPVQFEPEAFHDSLNRIADFDLTYGYLAHFGRIELSECIFESLHEHTDRFVDIAMQIENEPNRESVLIDKLAKYLFKQVKTHGSPLADDKIRMCLAMDAKLNAQGINVWLDQRNQY